ncbi:hypothetical protein HD597_008877 [Nonomuraea thailandensis]|uniref:Uncharacterized protein n=1 Tax=Nonomuraea thailandensis TaxID=1188745 RepID=A0A9X2GQ41_9ACTN|nr:hypothetical protein [Nonomuraea thailandensis]MCP2361857.1 hypothetical protein [Nonomuraea thailandensis]
MRLLDELSRNYRHERTSASRDGRIRLERVTLTRSRRWPDEVYPEFELPAYVAAKAYERVTGPEAIAWGLRRTRSSSPAASRDSPAITASTTSRTRTPPPGGGDIWTGKEKKPASGRSPAGTLRARLVPALGDDDCRLSRYGECYRDRCLDEM